MNEELRKKIKDFNIEYKRIKSLLAPMGLLCVRRKYFMAKAHLIYIVEGWKITR